MDQEKTDFLTTEPAAAYLGCSPSHLNRLRCYGGGPRYAKIGRRVRYAKRDLDAWREKQLVMSTSDAETRRKLKKKQTDQVGTENQLTAA
jgi:excisionase family DNA binding protein